MSDSAKDTARLDRIEHHLKLIKESAEKDGKTLSKIENALIGSEMNGHKGLVTDFDEMKTKVNLLEDFHEEVSVYIKQFKYVIGVLATLMVGMIIKLFLK